jgi:hypothetical protein
VTRLEAEKLAEDYRIDKKEYGSDVVGTFEEWKVRIFFLI